MWEQPDRDRFAIGALGAAWTSSSARGPRPLRRRRRSACDEHARRGERRRPGRPAPARCGWAASPSSRTAGGRRSGVAIRRRCSAAGGVAGPARRRGDRDASTSVCRPGDDPRGARRAHRAPARGAAPRPDAAGRPGPGGRLRDRERAPPEQFERAVAEAAARSRAGEVEKLVLAREVTVSRAGAAVQRRGRVRRACATAYPSCYCFCVGTPEAAFVGASPELLVRRAGAVVSTVALAGSTRRSADPAVDDHLGERLLHSAKDLDEHGIVVRTIERSLAPLSVWVDRRRRARARQGRQHPAPGDADPRAARRAAQRDRARRRAASDLRRSAASRGARASAGRRARAARPRLVRGPGRLDGRRPRTASSASRCAARCSGADVAHCYAGGGIVADSDPEAELAETEVKLQAVLPALTGPA